MLKCFRAMARTPSPLTISPGPTAAAAYLNRRHCSCSAPDCWVSVALHGNSRRYSDPILEERAGPPTVRLEWAAILHLIRKRGPTLHQSWTRKPGKGGPPVRYSVSGQCGTRNTHQLAAACGWVESGTWGKKTQNTVPCRSGLEELLTRMLPPCLRTISELTHKPRPVPRVAFVLTNGSKILDFTDSGMPGPVSATSTFTPFRPDRSWACRRRISMRPPAAASIALVSRFENTCRNSPPKATIGGTSLKDVRSSTLDPAILSRYSVRSDLRISGIWVSVARLGWR